MERRKSNAATGRISNYYFWHTYDQKEIDYIEECKGKLFGYEFKRQGEMRRATRREFSRAYPNAVLRTITIDNFEEFLGEK